MTVFSEQEMNEANAKPAGVYDFTVTEAKRKLSKKAEEAGEMEPNMFQVTLRLFNPDGEATFQQKDWLLFNDPRFASKVKGFCEAIGLPYSDETLANEVAFEGRDGRLELGIGKDGYNTVKKYIPKADKADLNGDSLPF